ncbi:MAG: hypothetical protein N3A71_02010 [Candidatus Dojkabacteria bacterium]|nr:hypothetical protein [Candidatus Dojkabacteria bacterium]
MDKRIIKIIFALISCIFIVIGVYLAYNVFYPEIYYQKNLKNNITPPPITESESPSSVSTPALDQENIPDRLIIPKIGVDMELGTDPKTLDKAGWVQNLYPDNSVMVIAAHRFGWIGMPNDRKVTHTLYNINKLVIGDEVIIQWNGERKIYKIKDITEATNNPSIKDGEVLIYTCKSLDSELRIFLNLEYVL